MSFNSSIRHASLVVKLRKYIPNSWVNTLYHYSKALSAAVYYGFPSKKLTVIGVTGSDGKTTTVTGIYHILKTAGKKVAMISTVEAAIGDKKVDTGFHVTSPDPWPLQKLIKTIAEQGYEYLVLEVTSHALAQYRVLGIDFNIGVLTNITHEHLDYHGTYDSYVTTKAKLFKSVNTAILNHNDRSHKQVMSYITQHNPNAEIILYDLKGDLPQPLLEKEGSIPPLYKGSASFPPLIKGSASFPPLIKGGLGGVFLKLSTDNVKHTSKGTSFICKLSGNENQYSPKSFKVSLNIPGQYNVYNSLAMIGATLSLGIKVSTIQKALASFPQIPGRMQVIKHKGRKIIIDHAHTPNAIDNLLGSLKSPLERGSRPRSGRGVSSVKSDHLITVFGSAGLRDVSKRPLMGQIAAKHVDIIILTAEDPRTEDVNQIIDQIAKGCIKAGAKEALVSPPSQGGARGGYLRNTNNVKQLKNLKQNISKTKSPIFIKVPNRQQAINLAIQLSQPGDTVAILGKGHEKSMCFGTIETPWSDQEAVKRGMK